MTANRLKHIAPKANKNVTAKVLTFDVERLPGVARVKHRGFTIEGEFWDLNALKPMIGRRIHPDDVLEWPRTICAAGRWYGQKEVLFAAEWEDGGHEEFMRKVWHWYDEADITVGHHILGFDEPHMRSSWALYGWAPPSPWKTIDTLRVARQAFGYESNTLDSLAKRLGIAAKTDKYDAKIAHAAVNGDAKAQKTLRKYNQGDIVATEGLLNRLRPWLPGNVHLGQWTGSDTVCPNCGSENVIPQVGKTVKANVTAYQLYRCGDCGSNVRGTTKVDVSIKTRAAR